MQVELPHYIWADTRFARDIENPLLFRASTKSYDIRTHQVDPLELDMDFTATGASPRVARSLVALSEIKMLTLPNLLAIHKAAVTEQIGVDPDKKYLTLTGFMMGVAEVRRSGFWEAGKINGVLSRKFLSPLLPYKALNCVGILDSFCRDPDQKVPGLADNFVVFYNTLLDTVVAKAEGLAPSFTLEDMREQRLPSRISETLQKQNAGECPGDKGFNRILSRLELFLGDLSALKPNWVKAGRPATDPQLTKDLWDAYCDEIASGVSFLFDGTDKTGHQKILTHEHGLNVAAIQDICHLRAGSRDVPKYCLPTPVADIEPLSRCPFFTNRGWLDTRTERPSYSAT